MMAGPGRPPGLPRTGGRVKGRSIDREARKLLTDKMAGDILSVYTKLGGVKWLLKFAEDNPGEFIRQGLSRLWPSPQKDDPDIQVQQINFDSNPKEAARRVAFMLASAVHDDPSLAVDIPSETIEPVALQRPEPSYPKQPPTDAPPLLQPEPEPLDDDRARWVAELPLTAQERADNALVRETRECNLSSYRGGNPAEQGLGSTRSPTSAAQDPRAAQRDRMLARRRKDLL